MRRELQVVDEEWLKKYLPKKKKSKFYVCPNCKQKLNEYYCPSCDL